MKSIYFSFFFISLFFGLHAQNKYELRQYEGISTNASVNDIILDKAGSAYVATKGGLYFVPSVNIESRTIIPDKHINALSPIYKKRFFIGSGNKYSSSLNPLKFYKFADKTVKVSALEKYQNKLWIGTNDGIYLINLKRNKPTHHYVPNNSKLATKKINLIYKDRYNVLWIGTAKGVLRYDGDKWKLYEKNHSIEGIYENNEGLWLLSNKELWNIDNINKANRWYRVNLKKDLKKGTVNDLVGDSRGRLIIASDILVRFDPYTGEVEKYGNDLGLVARKCTAIAIDPEDRIWIGTDDSGLFTVGFEDTFQKEEEEEKAPLEFALIDKSPSCYDDNDGSIKVIVKGGEEPYKIKWSTGDRDMKKIDNLIAGTYSVTVEDAAGKRLVKTIVLQQPPELSIKVKDIKPSTFGGGSMVSFDIKGGTPGYRLEIDGIATDTGERNLSYGHHEAKVIDMNGCDATVEFDVKGKVAGTDLDLRKMKVGSVIRINNLYFKADSAEITEESIPVLDEIYEFLKNNPGIIVEIGGHTNNIPSEEYCNKLSTERAKNVAEYLIRRGIEKNRVYYKGYGKHKPIASNATAAGRRKNQRVEMKILSINKEK